MNESKASLIGFGFAMVPHLAVAWGYVYFIDGGQPTFWLALGILIAVRLFFSIMEAVGSDLAWRFFARQKMVAYLLGIFRANAFPAKKYADDDFGNYCARLLHAQPKKPDCIRHLEYIQTFLLIHEKRGIFDGLRMHTVVDTAFAQYMAGIPKVLN